MATQRIEIIVTTAGLTTAKAQVDDVGRSARTTDGAMRGLQSAFLALGAAAAAGALIKYADAATMFNNTLSQAGLTGEAFVETSNRIYGAAIQNGQSANELAGIYLKLSSAASDLGLQQGSLINITTGIASAMRLSTAGASAQAGALQQLSQLFGGVKVQAQEFNSLVDGARPVLQAAAIGSDRWGGSISKLTADVKAGNVSVKDFTAALQIGLPQLEEIARNMPLTIGQAFSSLSQAVQQWVGASAEANVAIRAISGTIQFLANNIGVVMPILASFGALLAATFIGSTISAAVSNIGLLAVGVARMGAIMAANLVNITAFAAAWIAANAPMLVIVGTITLVITTIAYLYDKLANGGAAFASFTDAASAAAEKVKAAFASIGTVTDGKIAIDVEAGDAAKNMQAAITTGGKDAATVMKAGIVDASKQAAAVQKATNDAGVEAYNNSFGTGAATIQSGVVAGGVTASDAMKAAGDAAAASLGATGRNIFDLWTEWGDGFIGSFGQKIGDLVVAFQNAQTALLNAQAEQARANADLLAEQAAYQELVNRSPELYGPGATSGSSGSGGSSMSSGGGGGGGSIDYGSALESTDPFGFNIGRKRSDYAVKSASGTPSTDPNTTTPGVRPTYGDDVPNARGTTIINQFDPDVVTTAMGTARGSKVTMNHIRANAKEIKRVLGVPA